MKTNTLALTVSFLFLFSACAGKTKKLQTQPEPAAPTASVKAENIPAAKADLKPDPKKEMASKTKKGDPEKQQMRDAIRRLGERVEMLEDQLHTSNNKVRPMKQKRLVPEKGLTKHPSDGRGIKPLARSVTAGLVEDEAVQLFRKGLVYFDAGRFSDAILEFSSLLKDYADHTLAGSAQFYVGESYFRQKEYKLAKGEFERVMISYDRNNHLPETLKRITQISTMLKKPAEAEKNKRLLMALFPRSPAAEQLNQKPSNKSSSSTSTKSNPSNSPPTAPLPK